MACNCAPRARSWSRYPRAAASSVLKHPLDIEHQRRARSSAEAQVAARSR